MRSTLLASAPVAALIAVLAPSAAAQYAGGAAPHWVENVSSQSFDAAFSGPSIVALLGGATDGRLSISRCHGIDQIQGGRHQTSGVVESSWFRLAQGAGGGAIDIGLVSVQTATVDSLAGDACFSPYLPQAGAHHAIAGAAFIGQPFPPGTVPPLPTFYAIAFQWASPISAPHVLGTDSGAGVPPSPLLANLILEVQGPVNGGPGTSNVQYYLASTSERPSTDVAAPGGLANGNTRLASGVFFGLDPVTSNAISHTRLSVLTPSGLYLTPGLSFAVPGDTEFHGSVGVNTPRTWAVVNGTNDGTGAPDWNVSGVGGSVSKIDLRMLDLRAGAEGNRASSDYVPTLTANRALFLFSTTPARSMSQQPFTWDDRFGPPQPGDLLVGDLPTVRDPGQRLPVLFDPLTATLLGTAGVSLGTPFSPAGGPTSVLDLFQGGPFQELRRGVSRLPAPIPAIAVADPSLAGSRIGVTSVGIQADSTQPGVRLLSEFGSGLTVVLR